MYIHTNTHIEIKFCLKNTKSSFFNYPFTNQWAFTCSKLRVESRKQFVIASLLLTLRSLKTRLLRFPLQTMQNVSETLNQKYMDVLITFYDVWQRSHRRLLQDVFATSQKKIFATFIWDQCKTSLRLKIRRLIDVLKKGCRHFYFGQIQDYFGQIQDVFETKN